MSDQQMAEAACKSLYGSCTTRDCGYFDYYYSSSAISCNCNTPYGQYEFIYKNRDENSYPYVGSDYSGSTESISGKTPFVRRKTSSTCNGTPWTLALANLGRGKRKNVPKCLP